MQVILATSSRYRQNAFTFLGIPFMAKPSRIDESAVSRTDPKKLVRTLAKSKAETVARNHAQAIVIGLDSVGFFRGAILEKPKSRQEAFDRLRQLSGKMHEFYTGVYMINTATGQSIYRMVATKVVLRKLTRFDIKKYLDQSDNYRSMAVGFSALDHYSASFIAKLAGSSNNLIHGIPLEVIPELLEKVGYTVQ